MHADTDTALAVLQSVNKGKHVSLPRDQGAPLRLKHVPITKPDSELLKKTWRWTKTLKSVPVEAPQALLDEARPLFERFFATQVN